MQGAYKIAAHKYSAATTCGGLMQLLWRRIRMFSTRSHQEFSVAGFTEMWFIAVCLVCISVIVSTPSFIWYCSRSNPLGFPLGWSIIKTPPTTLVIISSALCRVLCNVNPLAVLYTKHPWCLSRLKKGPFLSLHLISQGQIILHVQIRKMKVISQSLHM